MKIQGARHTAKGALVKFVGVVDMDAAEALRDYVVLADRALLPPLQPGEYYLSDLVGATVSGPEGTIGTVREVCIHPTIETIVIDRAEGGSVELPLVDEWLGKVDTEAGQIELLSLDGLLDCAMSEHDSALGESPKEHATYRHRDAVSGALWEFR